MSDERIVILAHEKFPDSAKTALGVMRYGDQNVRAVLDRDRAGGRVRDHVPDITDAPIVESFADAYDAVDDIDALYIGISPIGGNFDESWRTDVEAAIEAGCDVVSGLHYFLNEDPELAALADKHSGELRDVREPDDDLTVATGASGDVDADVVCSVGTDCSVGKMTTSLEIVAAARERGIDAAFVPTGQTGIMIAGWGNPIDRVVSDFTAGAVEDMLVAVGDDHDLLVVEGQGSIVHPAYSAVTCGILHGSMADGLVLCHAADREAIHGYESFDLLPVSEYVDLYEGLANSITETAVVAGALNTRDIDEDETAADAVTSFAADIGAPAADPVRDGADTIVDSIVGAGLGTSDDPTGKAAAADANKGSGDK